MKKIEAFIREEKLKTVINALESVGYPGITITEVRGHGKQRGAKDDWHGQYVPPTLQAKLRVEVIVHDADVNPILNAIVNAARTQEFGAGKIFVTDVLDAVRIRTNQRGEIALD